jgi:hypothetical protein
VILCSVRSVVGMNPAVSQKRMYRTVITLVDRVAVKTKIWTSIGKVRISHAGRSWVHFFISIIFSRLSLLMKRSNVYKAESSLTDFAHIECKIFRFVTLEHKYNYHNSGHYPSSCILFKNNLNSIGLSVPHRNHISSPLRVHQVNTVCRFVTMVY